MNNGIGRSHAESLGRSSCSSRKVAYFTRKDARRFAARARKIHGNMRAYLCDECQLWHLGHNPAWLVAGKPDPKVYGRGW